MTSILSKLIILVAVTGMLSTEALAAKGSSSSTTPVVDPTKADKEAEKKAKEEAKALEKAQKDAEKIKKEEEKALEKAQKDAAKKADRIELLAKMKAEDSADDEVDLPEDEASLKYRSRGTKLQLTAEVEGFKDGDIFKMYVVINNADVLVATLELIGEAGEIPRQEIEFDEATWPTGVPMVLTAGTVVKLRDAQGVVVLQSTLQPK